MPDLKKETQWKASYITHFGASPFAQGAVWSDQWLQASSTGAISHVRIASAPEVQRVSKLLV